MIRAIKGFDDKINYFINKRGLLDLIKLSNIDFNNNSDLISKINC